MKLTDYELLYDLPAGEYDGRGVDGVRTTTIRAGRSLEVMCYPITRMSREATREAKRRRTTVAMAKINHRNRQRHIMRLLEMNFTERAWVFTGTYAYPVEDYGMCDLKAMTEEYNARKLPWDESRLRMDVRNFIEKIKRRLRKAGGDAKGLKWVIRFEEGRNPPANGLPPKYHFHAIIEAEGLTRDMLEACWVKHGSTTIERFKLRDDGAARLARYLCKQKAGGRWWSHSRNLKAPTPRVSDQRMSRRRMAMVAADVQRDGKAILEKLYPGYKLVELPDVKYSDFVSGCYIYARMRRRD